MDIGRSCRQWSTSLPRLAEPDLSLRTTLIASRCVNRWQIRRGGRARYIKPTHQRRFEYARSFQQDKTSTIAAIEPHLILRYRSLGNDRGAEMAIPKQKRPAHASANADESRDGASPEALHRLSELPDPYMSPEDAERWRSLQDELIRQIAPKTCGPIEASGSRYDAGASWGS